MLLILTGAPYRVDAASRSFPILFPKGPLRVALPCFALDEGRMVVDGWGVGHRFLITPLVDGFLHSALAFTICFSVIDAACTQTQEKNESFWFSGACVHFGPGQHKSTLNTPASQESPRVPLRGLVQHLLGSEE